MDNQSHTIIRLAVHLPLEQPVYFKPGSEEEALLKADISDSTLLAWFKLNQIDNKAHEYLYHNIPNHYTFYNKKWSPRKRDGKKVLRNLFASIYVWSHPTDALSLFNKYKQHLYEDFLHTHLNEAVASNLCLIELQKYLLYFKYSY
jgi:hypothetical protein